jgi:hypothetical protein
MSEYKTIYLKDEHLTELLLTIQEAKHAYGVPLPSEDLVQTLRDALDA